MSHIDILNCSIEFCEKIGAVLLLDATKPAFHAGFRTNLAEKDGFEPSRRVNDLRT